MAARLLQHATLLHLDPPRVDVDVDLLVENGRIAKLGRDLDLPVGGIRQDLQGARVLPGLVCAHTHLYSALSCGMPMPPAEPGSFTEMLETVWWKLDKCLDANAVAVSAAVGGLHALSVGTTTLIDHHASPRCVAGSLGAIDGALAQLGLRRVLCYEVSDRDGPQVAEAGLVEHHHLLEAGHAQHMRAVMIGAHASFTLNDATLARVGALARDHGVGVHIHAAEAVDDARTVGEAPVLRMARLGALVPGSILAHGVHLTMDELQAASDAGAVLTHQPRSNMNNRVGYAPLQAFPPTSALGTDGIGADMFAELQAAWFKLREQGIGAGPADTLALLTNGARLASAKLGITLGKFEPGAAADLSVLDWAPGPPLTADNLPAAMIFLFHAGLVRHVMTAGEWRMRDRRVLGVVEAKVDAQAARASARVWARMRKR